MVSMKLFSVHIIIALLLFFIVAKGQSDSNKLDFAITIESDSITKAELLDSISSVANVYFSYNPILLEADKLIKPQYVNATIFSIIIDIIDQEKLGFHALDNQIILYPLKIEKKETEQEPVFKTIRGHVSDVKKEESIPFCNILILGKGKGTISNLDGNFSVKISNDYFNDTLRFSCIGYIPYDIPIKNIGDSALNIVLDKTVYNLSSVNVVYYDPKEVLDRFFEKIYNNYEKDYTLLTSFYRETIKENSNYTDVSEAVLHILKAPYNNGFRDDLVKFVKGRKSSDVQPYDDIKFRLKGGPYYITKLDVVKNEESFINKEFSHLYVYNYERRTLIAGRPSVVISFSPIYNLRDILYEGVLYFDIETWALSRVEFNYTKQGLKEARRMMIEKEPKEFKAIPSELAYTVQYGLFEGKWYLLSAQSSMQIKLINREKKQKTKFNSTSEILITDIEKGDFQRFSRNEIFKPSEFFTEKIVTYDQGFWENYNIIEPEEELEHAIKNFENHDMIITNKQ